MEGIINLHKPTGITSAKALYRVRALTGQRKSGHGGTLDPAASGVLLLCLGRATKLVERIMDQPKVYRATARLDVTSESFDSDRPLIPVGIGLERSRDRGIEVEEATERRSDEATKGNGIEGGNQYRDRQGAGLAGDDVTSYELQVTDAAAGKLRDASPAREGLGESAALGCTQPNQAAPCRDEILQVLRHFEGETQQVPPAISAVKIAGQPAYKRKATDAPLELKPRSVRIYWIHLHSYDWPMIDFEMCCGRGTYVRALIRDLGQNLATGGCLTSLVRTRIGPFKIEDSWTMEAIAEISGSNPQQSTIDNRQSTIAAIHPYLIPFNEAARLLLPDAINIPPRP